MKRTQRFERRLKEAKAGDGIMVLRTYESEIQKEQKRQRSSRNAFVWTCCQQEIDQLTAERDAIDKEV